MHQSAISARRSPRRRIKQAALPSISTCTPSPPITIVHLYYKAMRPVIVIGERHILQIVAGLQLEFRGDF